MPTVAAREMLPSTGAAGLTMVCTGIFEKGRSYWGSQGTAACLLACLHCLSLQARPRGQTHSLTC